MFNHADYAIRQAQRAAAVTVLQQQHPALIPAGNNSLVAAAKNIRLELARAFPGIKFKVKSRRYSMGCSIDVSWIDGPTSDQVDPIAHKYQAGSFDGMTDCYNYEHSAWTDAFGNAKFVHTQRQYSERVLASVLTRVARYWGAEVTPSVDDYHQGRLYKVKANCDDLALQVSRALYKHTCAVGVAA